MQRLRRVVFDGGRFSFVVPGIVVLVCFTWKQVKAVDRRFFRGRFEFGLSPGNLRIVDGFSETDGKENEQQHNQHDDNESTAAVV